MKESLLHINLEKLSKKELIDIKKRNRRIY